MFETIFSQSGSQFRKVGLVEYTGSGNRWSFVFISSAPAEIVAGAFAGKEADDFGLRALHPQPFYRILFLHRPAG